MSIFDGLIREDEAGNIYYNQWVEWYHFLIPNKPEWLREVFRNLMVLFRHCHNCTALDGCYFVDSKSPSIPLHENCHCRKKTIDFSNVKSKAAATCDLRKFTEYIFKDEKNSKGKDKIFANLGFSVDDSQFLQLEYCRQALKQYLNGNYVLKNLNRNGQRLAIPITLNGKSFYSGWMLHPEGKISNTTPFGGWIR